MYQTSGIRRAQSVAQAVRTLVGERAHTGLLDNYPIDMEALVQGGLEVPVVYLPHLTVDTSQQYLCLYRGEPDWDPEPLDSRPVANRRLYGLLYVGPPSAVIFVQEGLPEPVRNYVLAHEIGHYLADVMLVREAWFQAMPDAERLVREAFDWGALDPHVELRALLRGLPRRPRPIMARGRSVDYEVPTREIDADLTARELMAPWGEMASFYEKQLDRGVPKSDRRHSAIWTLCEQYGLPLRIAAYYADDLERLLAPAPDTLDRLFGPLHAAEPAMYDTWALELADPEEDA